MRILKKLIPITTIFLLVAISVWLQLHLIKKDDNTWFLYGAQLMLHGGKYYYDFFELNPPLILYLYMPVVFFAHLLHLSFYTMLRIYTYGIVGGIIYLSNNLMKRAQETGVSRLYITLLLVFVFTILCGNDFAQREHFTILFITPYLLLAYLHTQKKFTPAPLKIAIGLMAGVAAILKPYFLIPVALVEIYLLFTRHAHHNTKIPCFRIEILSLSFFILIYLISIGWLAPEYLYKMLPFAMQYGLDVFTSPWILFTQLPIVFSFIVLILFIATPTTPHRSALLKILALTTIGFIIAYWAQHKAWYYHMLPAFSFATLLAGIICLDLIQQARKEKYLLLCMILLSIILGPLLMMPRLIALTSITRYQPAITQLNRILKQYNPQNGPVFTFCSANLVGILLEYTDANFQPQMFSDWMIPTLIRQPHHAKQLETLKAHIIANFLRRSPTLIFVDNAAQKPFFKEMPNFSYINFFSADPVFARIWKNYRYTTNFENFAVYKRIRRY